MNAPNENLPHPLTRRTFLKTSALATGSLVLLTRGTALASNTTGMMIHLYDEKSTAYDVTITVVADNGIAALAAAMGELFDEIPGDAISVSELRYGNYNDVNWYEIVGQSQMSYHDNGDGTFSVTVTGPIVMRHHDNVRA